MTNKSLIVEVNDIRTRMGLSNLTEKEISKTKGSVLNEGWFKDKINKLRNRLTKQQGNGYNPGEDEPDYDEFDNGYEGDYKNMSDPNNPINIDTQHGEVNLGHLETPGDNSIDLNKMDSDLKDAESEYPDEDGMSISKIDNGLKDAESEYTTDNDVHNTKSKMGFTPLVTLAGNKQGKSTLGKSTDPVISNKANSASNPKANYKLNYNITK